MARLAGSIVSIWYEMYRQYVLEISENDITVIEMP